MMLGVPGDSDKTVAACVFRQNRKLKLFPTGAAFEQYMCWGLNSNDFHRIYGIVMNPIVGVYIPMIRIPGFPVKGCDDHPQ